MIPGKSYTHIFFDLDNTLWDFNTNACSAMQIAFNEFERHFDKISFKVFFREYSSNNHLLWKEYRKGRIVKKDLIRLRFSQTFDALSIRGIDPVDINELYLAEMPGQTKLIEGAEQVLKSLKRRGCNLFVITNGFTSVQRRKMENAGILHYFTKIFTSDDVKSPKPSGEIFKYALQSANARKGNSLMVGDDIETDILGAVRYGIDAVCLTGRITETYTSIQELNHYKQQIFLISDLSELLLLI